jgi:hypothetical protein
MRAGNVVRVAGLQQHGQEVEQSQGLRRAAGRILGEAGTAPIAAGQEAPPLQKCGRSASGDEEW